MKQVIFIALALILSVGVYAQEKAATIELDRSPRWMIKTDIFYPIFSRFSTKNYGYSLIGEYGFREKQSIELIGQSFGYISTLLNTPPNEEYKTCSYENSASLMYKRYFGKKNAYTGFFTGGNIMLKHLIYRQENTSPTRVVKNSWSYIRSLIGINIGYQNYIREHFVVGITAGVNKRIPISPLFKEGRAAAWDVFMNDNQINEVLMLNIGYRF